MLMLMLLVLVSNGQAAGLGQTDGLNMFGTFAALGIVAV
jgi:hypothetical protein